MTSHREIRLELDQFARQPDAEPLLGQLKVRALAVAERLAREMNEGRAHAAAARQPEDLAPFTETLAAVIARTPRLREFLPATPEAAALALAEAYVRQ